MRTDSAIHRKPTQRIRFRQVADSHFDEPVIDHTIAGDIPEKRIATPTPRVVLKRGVKHFVSHHENRFVVIKTFRIDIDTLK